jgi:peroxiredoxin-like protein
MGPFFYDVDVKWTSNRRGLLSSKELDNKIEVATPPDFPNGIPGVWSPEHLLVAAASSCLMTTFLSIAEKTKLEFISYESRATGKLELTDEGFYINEIILKPKVVIKNEADIEKTIKLVEKAELNCLISKSIKSKVVLETEVVVG